MTTLIERLDLPAALPRSRSRRDTETDTVQFAQAALAAAKQEGLQLAVRARYIALVVIACLLPIINPTWEQLYYVVLLGLFALIGWGQVKVGRVGVSRPELALLFCDLALLTFILVVPNPFSSAHWAVAMQYHFGNFIYFFVLLSGATLAYSWRTVIAVGTWTSALWIAGMVWVWWQPDRKSGADRPYRSGNGRRSKAIRADLAQLDRVRRAHPGDRRVPDCRDDTRHRGAPRQ
ncbi:MAG TPA: hypothetical protein VNX23_14430 [Bradyrhizobium sp.]|uniref:hypothetical protein n=1 Tax=Bradyrhizobium sp. TaxID=376 RepID=UPI002CF01106|nr:hypothetical protein [Bradyrhizobium sp.]HXB78576.1 hypothetical protein [Bradyrhizobium sp.]